MTLFKEKDFLLLSLPVILVFAGLFFYSPLVCLAFLFLSLFSLVMIKATLNQKVILSFILLSILPGMLGRFSSSPKGGTTILLTDLLVCLLVLGYALKKIVIEKKWQMTKVHYLIFSFLFVVLISYFNGIYSLYYLDKIYFKEVFTALLYLVRWFGYSVIFFVVTDEVKDEKDIRKWVKWLLWIAFITAFLGFLQLIFYPDFFEMFVLYGWDPHNGRLLGTFFDPNLIGAFLTFNICIIFGILLHIKKNQKWYIYILLVLLIALVLTLSRSAYLGLMGGFVLLTFLRSRFVLSIGLLIAVVGVMLNPTVFDRIAQGVSIDDSAAKHIESWVDGIKIITAHPLLGVGYNLLPAAYDDLGLVDEWDVNNRSGVENSLFTVWVTTGIMGIIFYCLIWLTIIIYAYRNWKKSTSDFIRGLNLGIIGGFLSLFLSSLFVNVLFFSYIVVYMWFFSAFVFVADNIRRKASLETLV